MIGSSGSIDGGASDPPTQIYVCTTCTDRRAGPGGCAGLRLHSDLAVKTRDLRVQVVPVACLSVCRPNCALSFSAEGKWTYVFAIPSDTDLATILEGARLHAASPSGVIPWGKCPDALKEGVVARVPRMRAFKG